MKRIHLNISGKVQGVCFRANVKEEADMIGVFGRIRNTEDGKIEIIIEGEDQKVNELLAYCNHGPPGARIDNIILGEEKYQSEFKSFEISY